jgi:hypothetical protein
MIIVFNKRDPGNIEELNLDFMLQRMTGRCTYDQWLKGSWVKFTWEERGLVIGGSQNESDIQ